MSLEGQQLGEFEIIERLGQGGMGEVYKARQTSLDRFVALKTLHPSLAGDVDYITRFRQEARAAAGLNHPNLVQVYSAGASAGLHWFAMEYVEGESARVRLQRKGRLDPVEAIAIAIHVATALEYGWRKAVLIHRDIKPDNIFLSGDGEVKLGDLGLAKSAGQAAGLSTTGESMGTPHYMSPEQVEGRKGVDLRADIYGLGCTLYHLLSGQPPYVADSAVAVMIKHVSAPVPDLRGVWPECPAELAAVVEKMMQKQPEKRAQNYEDAIADLRRAHAVFHRASAPTVARQPVAGERKSAALVLAWVGGGIALLAALAALFYFAPWKRSSPTPGGTRSGRGGGGEERESGNGRAVSQTFTGEGGKKMGAGSPVNQPPLDSPAGQPPLVPSSSSVPSATSDKATPSTDVTPAGSNIVAVAPTVPPEATPAPATPAPMAQLPAPATPSAPTPPPAATPKPATEVEKWFAQVDGPQEEVFQKQVLKPYEAGVGDLRARYLASLEAALAKASAAGQLAEALVWRTEREAFEKAQNVATDDADTPVGVKTLRAAFRQQLARLDEDRAAKARALLAPYDAILAKNQTLLTQRQRLDDALLLKTKRDEIALAWVGSAQPTTVVPPPHPESAKSGPALLATKLTPGPSVPQSAAKDVATKQLASATKEAPFVNSLEMKFAPVPIAGGPTDGQRLLFSVWKTRVQDYEVFAKDTGRDWPKPNFLQGPTHPAVNLNWEDAQLFCQWLTEREQEAGRLPAGWSYRLPSDHEWSCAVGIGARENAAMQPIEKNEKISDAFPWGSRWPPPKGAGNYGQSLQVDKFEYTSPVGSFPSNRFGLRDLGGNAWEWCEDLFDQSQNNRVQRGASWSDVERAYLVSSHRNHLAPDYRHFNYGFRCVLGVSAR